jgi:hypothetical protein
LWLTALVIVALVDSAVAQTTYPTTATPDTTWGGYALPAQVPYQPTLNGAPLETGAAVGNPVFQPYPPTVDPTGQAVILEGTEPLSPGLTVPGEIPDTGYSVTNEPDLKKSLIPLGSRDGFFQRAKFTATWLPQLDSFSLGWTDLRTEVVTALPFFTRENPIIITPSYELHFLKSPVQLPEPLPARLHDLAVDFHVFRVFDNHWIADFAVQPGIYSDDYSFDSSEALRINGRALGVYAPTVDVKWALGVTYLDGGGWAKVVPIAGVIWTPTDDVEYQLVFPTPRVAWRLPWTNIPGQDERWFYVQVEYGNSAWAFQQDDGTPDVLASRDFRLIFGWERKIVGGIFHKVEVGYVFGRDIKVASLGDDDISMDSTILLRAGVSY